MSNFKNLKKSSGDLEKLASKINETGYEKDDRFWYPERDKAGNAQATIRFLPVGPKDSDQDGFPWVRLWTHGFKGPTGKWYIENSRTTLGKEEKDPATDYNSKLWNSTEDDKSPERKQARDQKRKLNYISNIYVISDPKHPENEGKVFLFRYGKKIFDKLTAAMNPQFEGDEPLNPFDFWKGANFKIRVRIVDDYPNYDLSVFESPSEFLDGNDTEIEKVWNQEYSLLELVDTSKFKDYDTLKARLVEVMGFDPFKEYSKPSVPVKNSTAEEISEQVETDDFNESDEAMSKFQELANKS